MELNKSYVIKDKTNGNLIACDMFTSVVLAEIYCEDWGIPLDTIYIEEI